MPRALRQGSEATRLACFVTPHGFGHAARACAIVEALGRRVPSLEVVFFTTTPAWFFADSLTVPHRVEAVACDVGMVQETALAESVDATVDALRGWLPLPAEEVEALGRRLQALGCEAVLCDVSALGIAAAEAARVPSVLVESFTWDWIYAGYGDPRLEPFAAELARWQGKAHLRVQTRPACAPAPGAVEVEPVSRRPRREAAAVRAALGVAGEERLVLVTMGGIPWRYEGLADLAIPADVRLVIPGGSDAAPTRSGPLVLLPHHSTFYHPDLVGAADAVVGKLGYSTLAEAWAAGIPYGFFPRDTFPESPVLAAFATSAMSGLELRAESVADGSWAAELPRLLDLPRRPRRSGGADAAAEAVLGLLASSRDREEATLGPGAIA